MKPNQRDPGLLSGFLVGSLDAPPLVVLHVLRVEVEPGGE